MPESKIKSALVLEDNAKDMLVALSILRSLEITEVCTFASSVKAQQFLEHALANVALLPDLLIVDLDLQHESGHELIRYWRSTAEIAKIPLIVWSKLGADHEEVCELFRVSCFVSKWKGREALEAGIREVCFNNCSE